MAVRGWRGALATAVGTAAGVGAAQLGLGYGLGIIVWPASGTPADGTAWAGSLTWSLWIAATSTVVGAICAARLGGDPSRPAVAEPGATDTPPVASSSAPPLWRAVLAVAGAIGSLITVVLVAVPARAATGADLPAPQATAAGYAVVGVMLGLLVAFWAMSVPAVARNVLGTAAWLWSLAVAAVVDDVVSGGGPVATQLGVWQLTSEAPRFWFRDHLYWPGAALTLGSALVIGALAARSAARQPGTLLVGTAVSGMAGPLLVSAGYLAVAPRLADVRAEQVSAYVVAPYAVIAGVAGSALVAALVQRSRVLAQHPAGPGRPDQPVVAGTVAEEPPAGDDTAGAGAEPAGGSGAEPAGDATEDSATEQSDGSTEQSDGSTDAVPSRGHRSRPGRRQR